MPRGHWIIADSQANNHDENTAVNVYYQMPLASAQDKELLLQQVMRNSLQCVVLSIATVVL